MLASAATVKVVAEALRSYHIPLAVVDPVRSRFDLGIMDV